MEFLKDRLQQIDIEELNSLKKIRSIQLIQESDIQKLNISGNLYCYKNMLSHDIYIDKTYYEQNKELLNKKILEIISLKQDSFFMVSSSLIEDDFLKAIGNNPNIKRIELGSKESPYIIHTKELDYFKNKSNLNKVIVYGMSNEVDKDKYSFLEYHFKEIMLQDYSLSDIDKLDTLYFKNFITLEEMDYLKKIPSTVKSIYFLSGNFDNIIKAITELSNYQGNIIIDVKDKTFPLNILIQCNFGNIKILIDNKMIPIEQYIKTEQQLYSYVAPLFSMNLSNLEKYIYLYDKVKNIKPYLENEDNYESARDLYQILFNEYIVCEGYSVLLVDLLKKVGIQAMEIGCTFEGQNKKKEYHSRVLVHLNDDKYHIDGYYLSDPTWDSIDKNSFKHILLTSNQVLTSERKFYSDFTDLLNSNSLEEMMLKLYKKPNYFRDIMKAIEEIDSLFYQQYIMKYSDLGNIVYKLTRNDITGIEKAMIDLYQYISTKGKKEISMDRIHFVKEQLDTIINIEEVSKKR